MPDDQHDQPPLTLARMREMRKRVEAATHGPWEKGGPHPCVSVIVCVDGGSTHPETAEPPTYEPIAMVDNDRWAVAPRPQALADAAFIAHAHDDIPALLDFVDDAVRFAQLVMKTSDGPDILRLFDGGSALRRLAEEAEKGDGG